MRSRWIAAERIRRGRAVHWSAVCLFACALPLACGEVLGIEQPNVANTQGGSPAAAGEGGDHGGGGTAGTAKGGSAGSGAQGGTAGATTDTGGGGAGATTDGGAAGSSMGGEGGEPPDPGPILGAPCDALGTYACTSANPRLVLLCSRDEPDAPLTWYDLPCEFDDACNARASLHPRCEALAYQCTEPDASRCRPDGVLDDCSDPFHFVKRRCPFGCEGGRCAPLSGDQLVVHTEDEESGTVAWPRSIPVCFVGPGELSAWLRDEVEHSLARYLDVEFSGFAECAAELSDGMARVAVEFLHDCRERLGSHFPFGHPGEGNESRVGICASYFDAEERLQQMANHEALFRFVVRHQFGHVLGRQDDLHTSAQDAMVRGLEESHAAEKVFSDETLVGDLAGQTSGNASLIDRYGRKPSGSLLTASGDCLTVSAGAIGRGACSSSGRFGLESGEVRDLSTSECLEVHAAFEAVTLGPCGRPSTAVTFARARWSTPSLCIAPHGQGAGSSVEATSCEPVGHASQAWHFEIISRDTTHLSARIRFGATNLCLTAPNNPVVTADIPTLRVCADSAAEQTFLLWPNGKISLGPGSVNEPGGQCLTHEEPQGVVSFFPCVWRSGDPRLARRFFLSGPLETPNGALRLAPNDANAHLTLSALEEPPADDQIFDFTF
jgi:hypothetical protein